MTAEIADISACPAEIRLDPEPGAFFLGLYRYRGRDFPADLRGRC